MLGLGLGFCLSAVGIGLLTYDGIWICEELYIGEEDEGCEVKMGACSCAETYLCRGSVDGSREISRSFSGSEMVVAADVTVCMECCDLVDGLDTKGGVVASWIEDGDGWVDGVCTTKDSAVS